MKGLAQVASVTLCVFAGACTTSFTKAEPSVVGTAAPVQTAMAVFPMTTVDEANSLTPLLCRGVTKYSPLPAIPASNYQSVSLDAGGKLVIRPEAWPSGNWQRNKLLPNIATEISVQDIYAAAEIGPFASGNGKTRRITIDFMKYRSEPVQDDAGRVYFHSRVGAGLRVTVNLTKWNADLSSGGLLPIAMSAKSGETRGYITADVIGMDASDITMAMPFTSDVSEESVQRIIEAMAVVRSKLHEEGTYIDPQFIARIDCVLSK
jgi:hypothetical protein